MIYNITDKAKERLKETIRTHSHHDLLLTTKNKGCSGIQFEFSLIEKNHNYEKYIFDNDFYICLDPLSHMFLIGTTIDLEKNSFEEKFQFKNNSITNTCGCGESYKFKSSE